MLHHRICRCVSLHCTNYAGVPVCYNKHYAGVLAYTIQNIQVCYCATSPNMQVC